MSNLVEQFKDITIEKVFKPVPTEDMAEYYYLPILLTDVPPKEWMVAFRSAYDSCQKYLGERILQHHELPLRMTPSAAPSVRTRDLTFKLLKGEPNARNYDLDKFLLFQYSLEGQGPHPNTQDSLKKSCEKANKEYRRYLAKEDKKRQQESERQHLAEEEQNRKDRRAEELTKRWFQD